jgi:hypothetical protein
LKRSLTGAPRQQRSEGQRHGGDGRTPSRGFFSLRVDPHSEHLPPLATEAGPYLPTALKGGESGGGASLVHGVELIYLDDEVCLRHQLAGEVDGDALDPSLAEVDDLAR